MSEYINALNNLNSIFDEHKKEVEALKTTIKALENRNVTDKSTHKCRELDWEEENNRLREELKALQKSKNDHVAILESLGYGSLSENVPMTWSPKQIVCVVETILEAKLKEKS